MSGWPVRVESFNSLSMATALWRYWGELYVTAVCKATYAIGEGGPMTAVDPAPVSPTEVPGCSVNETVPALQRAELVIFAPAARDEGPRTVTVTREGTELLSTTIGPQGVKPMTASHVDRLRLLGATSAASLLDAASTIPDNFNWSYFQCVPKDQQLDMFHCNEVITLAGFGSAQPIVAELPRVYAAVCWYGLGKNQQHPMALDMVTLDVAQRSCSVIWRCRKPIDDGPMLKNLKVAGLVVPLNEEARFPPTLSDEPIHEDRTIESQGPASQMAPFPLANRSTSDSSTPIPGAPWETGAGEMGRKSMSPSAPISGDSTVDAAPHSTPYRSKSTPLGATVNHEAAPGSARATPFQSKSRSLGRTVNDEAAPTSGSATPFESGSKSLNATDDDAPANSARAMPFKTGGGAAHKSSPALSIPGAPWSHEQSAKSVSNPLRGSTTAEMPAFNPDSLQPSTQEPPAIANIAAQSPTPFSAPVGPFVPPSIVNVPNTPVPPAIPSPVAPPAPLGNGSTEDPTTADKAPEEPADLALTLHSLTDLSDEEQRELDEELERGRARLEERLQNGRELSAKMADHKAEREKRREQNVVSARNTARDAARKENSQREQMAKRAVLRDERAKRGSDLRNRMYGFKLKKPQ